MAKGKGTKLIAQNKKAYHDYFIEETIQAGISLAGTEVKSLRMGKCSLKESYIQIKDGEAFIYNMHISPYEQWGISLIKTRFAPEGFCCIKHRFASGTMRCVRQGIRLFP